MSTATPVPATSPLLRMHGITKRFDATTALDGVSIDLAAGRVLALIGENGAGKSTLMKVLSGAIAPDAGAMTLAGRAYRPSGPHDARSAGVAMIYQELNLAADLSVEDNVMLGQERHAWGWLDRRRQRTLVHAALSRLGHGGLDPTTKVGALSVAMRQLVEIARALVLDARVIVFDEPTSSLPQRDVVRLFEVVRRLRASGLGIVYISHFLEEIRRIADAYVVLRDGKSVAAGELAAATDAQLVTAMVGRAVDELFPRVPHTPGEEILSLDALCGRRMPRDVSLRLRRGEILGIAGLVGAGRTELLRCAFGLDPTRGGTTSVRGRVVAGGPRRRIRAGLGLLSEDRKSEGLAQQLSIADNLTLSRPIPPGRAASVQDRLARFGWINLRRRRQTVQQWIDRLRIRARGPGQEVQSLSGGNQQKVAIARILHQDADVLLLDEPTRGVDVGTKSEIYRWIGQLAADGKGIVFVSSYLPELLAVCDRVAVMVRGRLRDVRPIEAWTAESMLAAAVSVENVSVENVSDQTASVEAGPYDAARHEGNEGATSE